MSRGMLSFILVSSAVATRVILDSSNTHTDSLEMDADITAKSWIGGLVSKMHEELVQRIAENVSSVTVAERGADLEEVEHDMDLLQEDTGGEEHVQRKICTASRLPGEPRGADPSLCLTYGRYGGRTTAVLVDESEATRWWLTPTCTGGHMWSGHARRCSWVLAEPSVTCLSNQLMFRQSHDNGYPSNCNWWIFRGDSDTQEPSNEIPRGFTGTLSVDLNGMESMRVLMNTQRDGNGAVTQQWRAHVSTGTWDPVNNYFVSAIRDLGDASIDDLPANVMNEFLRSILWQFK